jgi:transposase
MRSDLRSGGPSEHALRVGEERGQQAVLMMHRARTLVVSNRTAQVNQIRGLLGELGLIEKAAAGNPGGCR